ncbi:MAG TPA: helical backbone metal receptor [Acidimicrobiia bacterium]
MRFRNLTIGLVVLAAACGGAAATTTAPLQATTPVVTTTAGVPSTAQPSTTQATPTTGAADFPVTIDADNGSITIAAAPAAVVSLSATATEILFAIGAGDQVVAVDEFSTYPPEAPLTDLSGLTPNVEAISVYEPDLVVVSFDPGDLVSSLEALGIPVVVQGVAVTLDDTHRQIEHLGAATGHAPEAAALNEALTSDLAEIAAALPAEAAGLTYYHELGQDLYSATSATFIGRLYALLGLVNVADGADEDGAAFGYPQLSEEYLIEADPDLIFLADTVCCGQSAATVAERPGWEAMQAVRNGAVVELDDDVASRWGPRIVDLLRAVGDAVRSLLESK